MNNTYDKRTIALFCLFLAIIVLAVYGRTYRHDFINLDDNEYVYDNPVVRDGLTLKGLKWAFTTGHAGNWHPLTWLSHMLDCRIFGVNPGAHHLVSVFIHLLNSLLLYLVFLRLTGSFWRSAALAVLFAIHPLRVESVAWISERKDLLSGLFWILALWAYSAYVRLPSLKRYALTLLLFVLGLLSKPMVVTFPVILLILDIWPLKRISPVAFLSIFRRGDSRKIRATAIRLIIEKIPLLVLAILSSVITMSVQAKGGAVSTFGNVPVLYRILNAFVSYNIYIVKTVVPVRLAVLYPHPGESQPIWIGVVTGLVFFALSVAAVKVYKSKPYLLTGWAWFAITLLPVIGLVQVGAQAMADRYTYIPGIGLTAAVIWSFPAIGSHPRKIIVSIVTGLFVTVCVVLSYMQVCRWSDSISLYEHTLSVTADNHIIHHNLGCELVEEGRGTEAMHHFAEAVRIEPNYPEARSNLGAELSRQGRFDDAIVQFREALRIDPGNEKIHVNFGVELAQRGRYSQALSHFEEALRLKPDNSEALNNIGIEYERTGEYEKAVNYYEEAMRIDPYSGEAYNNLGNVLVKQSNFGEALEKYQTALAIDPELARARFNIGYLSAEQGKNDEAVGHFLEALRIDPGLAEAHNNIANILTGQEKFAEAIEHYTKALEIDPGYTDAEMNLANVKAYLRNRK